MLVFWKVDSEVDKKFIWNVLFEQIIAKNIMKIMIENNTQVNILFENNSNVNWPTLSTQIG